MNKENVMKYRLGLDLGVGSIGSAVIELDENGNALDIKDAGVRIFEVSEGAEGRRVKRTARKNLIRTRKRLQLLARKLFENGLWVNDTPEGTEKLRSKSPYTIRYEALNEKLSSPYYVGRAILHLAKHRGAGFVSAAEELKDEEVTEEENKKTKRLSSYEQMVKHLKETNSRTIGEYFYNRLEKTNHKNMNKSVIRQKRYKKKDSVVDYAIPRYLVKDEFNQIWDNQAKYFQEMNKEGLKQEIFDILFYEKSVAPFAVGKCIYFRDEDRLLKAHPLSEMRRIYEEVNNIRLETKKLTLKQRDLIINELLLKGENAGKQKIKKLLNLTGQVKISLVDDKVIKAYLYSRKEFQDIEYIKNLSEEKLVDFIEFLAEPKEDINNPNSRLLNEDSLIKKLKVILNIDDEKVIGEILTKLPKDRGMIGKSASLILVREMKKEVLSQREITDRLAKDDKRFEASEEIARKMQGKYELLPYYGEILVTDTQYYPPLIHNYKKSILPTLSIKEQNALNNELTYGKVANPAVHMILNQLRLVVNDIIRIYGRPYEISIELGRNVGKPKKEKNGNKEKQKENEKLNNEAKKYLLEHKIYINKDNIRKYKLAKKQNFIDAYEPSRPIPQTQYYGKILFPGFEVEHIIPRAEGGTDTMENLCLVNEKDNKDKGNMFAYEYFMKNKTPETIRAILENARRSMPEKAWRFEPNAREEYKKFGDNMETTRYMTDTRYVSKLAMRYLRSIVDCNNIHENRIIPIKGKQTAKFRKQWYLDGLEYDLMGLSNEVPRRVSCDTYWIDEDTGEIIMGEEKPDIDGNWHKKFDKSNKEWFSKPRIDHRHHAIDAITVACISREMINKIANETTLYKFNAPLPLISTNSTLQFRNRVLSVLKDVKVSHKPNHTKNGELHKATGKTILCKNPEPNDKDVFITVYTRKIHNTIKSFKDLDKLLVKNTIKDEWHERIKEDRIKQAKLKEHFELYSNTAEQILIRENENATREGKTEIEITEGRILTKSFQIIQDEGLWNGENFYEYECKSSLIYIDKHKIAYNSDNNHCMDIYELNGDIKGEVITRFNINKLNFISQWKKDGGKPIWSVQQGDILELDTPDEWKTYVYNERCLAEVIKFRYGRNQLGLKLINDARNGEQKEKKFDYMLPDSKMKHLEDKGVKWLCKHKARKIELTPFGKIKKKHKVLWDGKKN